MRFFQRVLLCLALMLFAVVALNALRLASAPAQGNPGGEGQARIRNGDVNCDGLLNITDPILVLNWLFGDGPEPCAIAQTDTCCADLGNELAALRAEVAKLSARVPSPRDIFLLKGEFPLPAQGGEAMVYKVPDDKWLVLTRIASGKGPRLFRRLNGASEEVPINYDERHNAPTGFPIPPGSELVLSYPQSYFDPPAPFTVDYFLHGYLAGE